MAVATGTALLAAGVLRAGASAYGAYESGQAADDYADSMGASANAQAAIAGAQWDRYMTTFAPVENQLVGEASKPLENQSYFANMMAGVDKGYSDASANVAKTTAANHQYGSGIGEARQASLDLNRVRDKASTYASAENSRLTHMMNVAAMGKGLPASAQNGYSSATNAYGNMASMYNNAAGQGWNALGNTAGNLTQLYMMNKMAGGGSVPALVADGYNQYNGVYNPSQQWA